MKKALVVLSGGQDSTTCLFVAKRHFDEIYTLTFDYGQRHSLELASAAIISSLAQAKAHEVVRVSGILKGTSPLVDPTADLETYTDFQTMSAAIGDRVEKTFVPMRNDLFLTIAANHAFCMDIRDIYTGVCQADNANYPDCTQAFINYKVMSCNRALGLGTQEMAILTPLLWKSKAESIKIALSMDGCYEALAFSHTAYDGLYPPTGKDHASVLRANGFEEADVPDPLVVRAFWMGHMDKLPETHNYSFWEKQIADGKAGAKTHVLDSLRGLAAGIRATLGIRKGSSDE